MTIFWRDGFWRTSANGNVHWVTGHHVDRDNWDRYGGSSHSTFGHHLLRGIRAHRGLTSRFVNPNAECPVCGAPVFFYQNEHGSRVFFDELAPPWPKHPCTDNSIYSGRRRRRGAREIEPTMRDSESHDRIVHWQRLAGLDPAVDFNNAYSQSHWRPHRVAFRINVGGNIVLILEMSRRNRPPRRKFIETGRLPRSVALNAVVFVKRNRLAYFDRARMTPKEVEFTVIQDAGLFVDRLLNDGANA
jgi:hypothetical protein